MMTSYEPALLAVAILLLTAVVAVVETDTRQLRKTLTRRLRR
jgi:hypothetical protein